jgi:hypothetical protein
LDSFGTGDFGGGTVTGLAGAKTIAALILSAMFSHSGATFVWALESALAGRVSEKIPRLARLGLFFSWARVDSGVFYGVALSALVSALVW